jgi:hypothetical protein
LTAKRGSGEWSPADDELMNEGVSVQVSAQPLAVDVASLIEKETS